MIKVLLVEDNFVVRKGLSRLINTQEDLSVISEVIDGRFALAVLEQGLKPDIILTDLNMPVMDGFELLSRLQEMNCSAQVIILSMHGHKEYRNKALAGGARGYLLKGGDEEVLFQAIRAVHAGAVIVSDGLPL